MSHNPKNVPSSHGNVRGEYFNRRSSQFEGRFGRIFRSLPPAEWAEQALKNLAGDGLQANRMSAPPETDKINPHLPFAPSEENQSSRLHDDEENSGIDAGYTYLGQFIDHDITFDPASSLQQRNDVDALIDFRTPQLDLDCIYGRGPDDQPYMYEGNGRKLQLGRPLTEGREGKIIGHDLPRHSWEDSDGKHHRALIGDKRNDENVIVSQLHSVFLQFHNRMADDNKKLGFSEIQRRVRWHYQYVVLNDFLYKIAQSDVIEAVLPHLKSGKSIYDDAPKFHFYKPKHDAFVPIEFSAAAYRFGHSLVRPIYRLNTRLSDGNNPDNTEPSEIQRGINGRQFIFAGLKNRGLNGFDQFPQFWGIDWNLFFDLTGDKDKRVGKDRTQPAYKIDTSLVNPLAFLAEFSKLHSKNSAPLTHIEQLQPPPRPGELPNLAFRNLLRGMSMGLPSGQDIARAMGLKPLEDEKLKVGKATTSKEYEKLDSITVIDESFAGKAPLWYYILAEAQHDWLENGGKADTPAQLGEVGSRIVVETLAGILWNDSHSFLRQAPCWKPAIGKNGEFMMADFINYALG